MRRGLHLSACALIATALFHPVALCAQPSPPIKLPFAVHLPGETAFVDVTISADRVYPFSMLFGFKARDAADRERVAKLVGQYSKDKDGKWVQPPAIEIPLHLEIRSGRAGNEKVIVDQVVKVGRLYAWGADSFSRHLGVIRLTPGYYQIKVQILSSHPELQQTPVTLAIDSQTRGDVFYWSKRTPSERMAEVLEQIRKRDLLNDPSALSRLPDNSTIPSKKEYPNSESFSIPMPVGVWDACSFGIFIDGEENMSAFWVSKNCGGKPREVFMGPLSELFRE